MGAQLLKISADKNGRNSHSSAPRLPGGAHDRFTDAMRINRESEQAVEDFEPPAAADAPAGSTPARQAALDQAGVTSASGFAPPAQAPVAAPPQAQAPANTSAQVSLTRL